MTKEETRRAAQVMLDSLKPGAVVEFKNIARDWTVNPDPNWNWEYADYRIAEPKHTKIADLPPVCWVRAKGSRSMDLVCGTSEEHNTILVAAGWTSFAAYREGREYSADRLNWTSFT